MKAIVEMVEFFAEEGVLSGADLRAIRESGFWNACDDYLHNQGYDPYDDYDVYGEDAWSEEPDPMEEMQASLERFGARGPGPTWVGKSRKRWWKGYKVGKVARARRAQRG